MRREVFRFFETFTERYAGALLVLLVFLLSVLYSTLSIVRHNHFQSGGFDLGIYDQAVWQYSRFLWPYNTVKERFILGDHLTLTLPLLAPLFWLWDDVRMLLIFQATWISCSVFAVYAVTRHRGFSPIVGICVSLLYSLFYGVQYAVFFDFHPVVFGVGLLAWLMYFFEAGKRKLFIATLILLLGTQENMGLALASLGFIYVFRTGMRKTGTFWIIGGIAVSLVVAKIITFFSPVGFQYTPRISTNPVIIIRQFVDSPEKRQVLWYSYSWFSFVPLFSVGSVLAVLFDLAQYFVTGPDFQPMWTPFKHHRAILAVLLILGVLDVFEQFRIKKINVVYIAVGMTLIAFGLLYVFHLPLNKLAKRAYWQEEPWMADDRKLLKSLDPVASLATQQNFVPHLTHRKEIYLVWPRLHEIQPSPCGRRLCWWLDFAGRPDYLVVDLRPNQWLTQILESNENFSEAVVNMERAGKIQLESSVGLARMYHIVYGAE